MEGAEENYKKPQSGQPIFKSSTSRALTVHKRAMTSFILLFVHCSENYDKMAALDGLSGNFALLIAMKFSETWAVFN